MAVTFYDLKAESEEVEAKYRAYQTQKILEDINATLTRIDDLLVALASN